MKLKPEEEKYAESVLSHQSDGRFRFIMANPRGTNQICLPKSPGVTIFVFSNYLGLVCINGAVLEYIGMQLILRRVATIWLWVIYICCFDLRLRVTCALSLLLLLVPQGVGERREHEAIRFFFLFVCVFLCFCPKNPFPLISEPLPGWRFRGSPGVPGRTSTLIFV